MHALVTGGGGFFRAPPPGPASDRGGTASRPHDLSTGYEDNVNPKADLVVAPVWDEDAVRDAAEGAEVVFHQAAHRAVLRSVERPLETDRANVAGTLTVLLAARDAGARRVVYASSSSVYGGAAPLPTLESSPLLPRSPYAVTKL